MNARAMVAGALASGFGPFILFNLVRDARWLDLAAICGVASYFGLLSYLAEQGDLTLRNALYSVTALSVAGALAFLAPAIKRIRQRRLVMRLDFPFGPTRTTMVNWCTMYLRKSGWRLRRVPEVDIQISRPGSKTFYLSFYPAGEPVSEATFGVLAPAAHMRKNRVVVVAYEPPTPYIVERGRQRGISILHYSELDTLVDR